MVAVAASVLAHIYIGRRPRQASGRANRDVLSRPSGAGTDILIHRIPTTLTSSPIVFMARESKRPGVTEMHVRMDCNGCVNRIKKALQGVEGIYEVQVDFQQQKLTVIGRASPEKIVKAIKKTRKIATICSHTEASSAPEQQPQAGGDTPASADPTDPPPVEAPASAAEPPAEQTTQDPPPVPEDTDGEVQPSPEAADGAAAASQPGDTPDQEAKDVGEIHMIHHHYPHHRRVYQLDHWPGYHRCGDGNGSDQPEGYNGGSSSSSVIHSYSRYRPAGTNMPSEYGYLRPPSQSIWYGTTTITSVAAEPYGEDYCRSSRSAATEGNYNITSMFSDENPNACTVV